MPIPVHLESYELVFAALVGVRRRVLAIQRRSLSTNGSPNDSKLWDVDIEGACGEMAAAKGLGLYWGGTIDTFHREADVCHCHIRFSRHEAASLIIRDTDPDGLYVLVTGTAPDYLIVGWLDSREARRHPEWKRGPNDRPPAYFVPQDALMDPKALNWVVAALDDSASGAEADA